MNISECTFDKTKANLRLVEIKAPGDVWAVIDLEYLKPNDIFRVDGKYVYKAIEEPKLSDINIWGIVCEFIEEIE
jgi:hypothetical protein